MKVTALSLTPPAAAASNPRVTHELLASVLAKYSRSNEGLQRILAQVDLDHPDESIARILKFVDYGHASIGGLTGGIAIAVDGVTMFAAYKLFELSPMADGQESSTRYISLDQSGLPSWTALGFTDEEAARLSDWALLGLELYQEAYAALDEKAKANPAVVRVPEALRNKPAAIARLQKNYALDRTRYFLPFAMKTNVAIVQTARMWTETLAGLLSSGIPELLQLAGAIHEALVPYAPNLMRHARQKSGWTHHMRTEAHMAAQATIVLDTAQACAKSEVFSDYTDTELAAALQHRENRYDRAGIAARDTTIRCSWSGMAIAELRDLNRHRTGCRFSSLQPQGFYLPDETKGVFLGSDRLAQWGRACRDVLEISSSKLQLRPYTLALGTQVHFRHTMQFDKFVYEAELRTGAGAHFRYAQHLTDSVGHLSRSGFGQTANAIQIGQAEPE